MPTKLQEQMAILQAPVIAAVGFSYNAKVKSVLAPSAAEASRLPMNPQDCHLTCWATLNAMDLPPEVKKHISRYHWQALQISTTEPEAFAAGRRAFLGEIVRGVLELGESF